VDHCATSPEEEYSAVTEPQRLALHKAACEALGDEEGDTLMALTPPANTDMATMQALGRTEERLDARIAAMGERLDARISAMDERLDARIAVMAAELRSHTWKAVVRTGVALYLAMIATMFAGAGLLLRIVDVV
jgi:hypothetical protein